MKIISRIRRGLALIKAIRSLAGSVVDLDSRLLAGINANTQVILNVNELPQIRLVLKPIVEIAERID